jgi:hypothetical protein
VFVHVGCGICSQHASVAVKLKADINILRTRERNRSIAYLAINDTIVKRFCDDVPTENYKSGIKQTAEAVEANAIALCIFYAAEVQPRSHSLE